WRPVPASAMLVVLAVASVSNDRVAFTWQIGGASCRAGVALLAPIGLLAPQSVVKLYAGSLLARLASEAGAVPLLASVIASGPVVWPTWISPKASAIGLTSSAPWRPVPLRAMLVVLAVASVSNDRVAFTW